MKFIVIFLSIITALHVDATKAQTTQEYLNNCFEEEKENGAIGIIFSAKLCSACNSEPKFEGYMLIKEPSGSYRLRYLEYINKYRSVKVLNDETYVDENLESVFKIVQKYQDSIFYHVSQIEGLLIDTLTVNGKKTYKKASGPHGEIRHLRVYDGKKSVSSFEQIFDLNHIHEKAYYYWLLNSCTNNYILDFGQRKLNSKN